MDQIVITLTDDLSSRINQFTTDSQCLRTKSEVFRCMLERQEEGNRILEVTDGFGFDAFATFLRWLESDDDISMLLRQTTDVIIHLNYLADKYHCRTLDMDTTSVFLGRLRAENAVVYASLTLDAVWNPNLLMSAKQVFQEDTTKALSIDPSGIPANVLIDLLQINQLNISSELELFEFLEKWRECGGLEKEAREILGYIRLFSLTNEQFLSGPARSFLLSDSEKLALFVFNKTRVIAEDFSLNRTLDRRSTNQRNDSNVCLIAITVTALHPDTLAKFLVNRCVRLELVRLDISKLRSVAGQLHVSICDEGDFIVSTKKVDIFSTTWLDVKFDDDLCLMSGVEYQLKIKAGKSAGTSFQWQWDGIIRQGRCRNEATFIILFK